MHSVLYRLKKSCVLHTLRFYENSHFEIWKHTPKSKKPTCLDCNLIIWINVESEYDDQILPLFDNVEKKEYTHIYVAKTFQDWKQIMNSAPVTDDCCWDVLVILHGVKLKNEILCMVVPTESVDTNETNSSSKVYLWTDESRIRALKLGIEVPEFSKVDCDPVPNEAVFNIKDCFEMKQLRFRSGMFCGCDASSIIRNTESWFEQDSILSTQITYRNLVHEMFRRQIGFDVFTIYALVNKIANSPKRPSNKRDADGELTHSCKMS
jgi:hypothetical protein